MATSANTSRMISLNDTNWLVWKPKMMDLLYFNDLAKPIEKMGKKPEKYDDEDWATIDRKAIGVIRQWVDDTVFHRISNETSSYELWKKLEGLFERKTVENKAYLIRKLVNLKYKQGKSITEHLNEMKSIVNQLATMKMLLEDELQALLLLSSLPDSWETLVVSLSNSTPGGVITMSQVTSSLLNEEKRRKRTGESQILTYADEPESYETSQVSEQREQWQKAMQEEMDSLMHNHTYDLVARPKGKNVLKNKWVYMVKVEEKSSQPMYKARLVVKDFAQKKGFDFDEIFSLGVKMTSIRTVLGLAASMNLEVEHLDMKTSFLHSDLEEEVYIEQPEGFKVKSKEHMVCRLRKSLYGLEQEPRQWYRKFEAFMVQVGYKRITTDHYVFIKRFPRGDFIILLLYVDDMLIVGQDSSKIATLKKELGKAFDMKDLGPVKQILGMHVFRDRQACRLWLSQKKYIEKVLQRFNMNSAKPVACPLAGHFKLSSEQSPASEEKKQEMERVPYASAVGNLMYAMVCTRPDLAYAVGVVSRILVNPGKEHWRAVKWIMRYLRGTTSLSLCYGHGGPVLQTYIDADFAEDVDSRKSTSGYLVTFAGGAIIWQSKLQKRVALSSAEAKYIAMTECSNELLWLKRFCQELGVRHDSYVVYCDSQSVINLGKNPYHSSLKHIDVSYHWIRKVLEEKQLQLEKIHTDNNGSNMMTKSLLMKKFEACRKKAGLVDLAM